MRVGVLDIGSNTGHLLVVDAHGGAAPLPAYKFKQPLRLAEHLDEAGDVSQTGIDALTAFTAEALRVAEDKGCEDILGFATSAVRDAGNSEDVLEHVQERTGVMIDVLAGEDEARLTFLAVRRWFGWSAGRLAVFDIGGGSLEIAGGADEAPDVAWSLPLGAARLARAALPGRHRRRGRPSASCAVRSAPRSPATPATCSAAARRTARPRPRRRSARWPASAAPRPRRTAPWSRARCRSTSCASGSPSWWRWRPTSSPTLPGVSPSRAHQIVPGALVAEGCMDIFDLTELEVCPWALREGVILERLDQLSVLGR